MLSFAGGREYGNGDVEPARPPGRMGEKRGEWPPALPEAPGTRETVCRQGGLRETRDPSERGTRTQPSFRTSTVMLAAAGGEWGRIVRTGR